MSIKILTMNTNNNYNVRIKKLKPNSSFKQVRPKRHQFPRLKERQFLRILVQKSHGFRLGFLEQDQKKSLGFLHWYQCIYPGFILLILPFSFAYIMELQKQTAKIMGGKSTFIQNKWSIDFWMLILFLMHLISQFNLIISQLALYLFFYFAVFRILKFCS